MHSHSLTPTLRVSGQIMPNDLAPLAQRGIRSIINNRPDGEGDDQPESATLQAQAERLGLAYRHIPVTPGQWPSTTVDAFAQALDEVPEPTLAFCRSGHRSTSVWALQACARGASVDHVMQQARQAGYDLAGLFDQLQKARSGA